MTTVPNKAFHRAGRVFVLSESEIEGDCRSFSPKSLCSVSQYLLKLILKLDNSLFSQSFSQLHSQSLHLFLLSIFLSVYPQHLIFHLYQLSHLQNTKFFILESTQVNISSWIQHQQSWCIQHTPRQCPRRFSHIA